MGDANNSPNREQDQGPYTLALKVRYLQTCVRRQTRRVIIVTVNCQERTRTRSRSNTCSDLKNELRTGASTACPSKADVKKLIDEKLRAKERWSLNADTGRQAQLRELRDILSCAKSQQQALSQKKTKHQSHLGKVQEGTRGHSVILNVKDDQKIVQDNALPKRMNRLTFESDELGRTR